MAQNDKNRNKKQLADYDVRISELICEVDSLSEINNILRRQLESVRAKADSLSENRRQIESKVLLRSANKALNSPYNRRAVTQAISQLEKNKRGKLPKEQKTIDEKLQQLNDYRMGVIALEKLMNLYRSRSSSIFGFSDFKDEMDIISTEKKDDIKLIKSIPFLNKVYEDYLKSSANNARQGKANIATTEERDFLQLCEKELK